MTPTTENPTDPVQTLTAPTSSAPPVPPAPSPAADSHVPVHYSRGTGVRVLVIVVVVGAVLGAAYLLGDRSRSRAEASLAQQTEQALAEPARVNVAAVAPAAAAHALTLPAQCDPFLETTLYARVSGYIRAWHFDIGDRVKKGDVLCNIETPELDSQLAEARARILAQQAEVKLQQSAADFAKVSLDRYKSAAPDGAVSEQELDQKSSEYQVALAKLQSARATLNLDQAALASLESMAKFKNVAAPFDGIITRRSIDIGALVTAGSTTNTTPLFQLARFDTIRVAVNVPQIAAPEIAPGMAAGVTAEEYPGQNFAGRVDRTSDAIDPHSGTLHVEILVPNPQLKLLPGMYVSASLQIKNTPAFRVPASAVVFRPDGPVVAAVARDGTLNFRHVRISKDLGDVIELASGVGPTDRVVLNVPTDVTDGERVAVAADSAVRTAKAPAPVRVSAKGS